MSTKVPGYPTKSEPTKKLFAVRTPQMMQFFNIHGTVLSSAMPGVELSWDGSKVIVRHEGFPGKEYWLHPQGCQMEWRTEE